MSLAPETGLRGSATTNTRVVAWTREERQARSDTVAVEEPLEIRLAGWSVAVTMRTPGDDFDLAAGFLFTEGIVRDWTDVSSIVHCPTDDASSAENIVNVNPTDPSLVQPERWQRNFFATSSCGVCGKASIAAVRQEAAPIVWSGQVHPRTLYTLDRKLRGAQDAFTRTGGLHAAGLFDVAGNLIAIREDVGRHNAVDKIIGQAVRSGQVPLRDRILVVSSRGSFEIVQKAWMAGIPVVATVSAPSSLAIDMARSAGITLLGFLRSDRAGNDRFNAYAGAERIISIPEEQTQ